MPIVDGSALRMAYYCNIFSSLCMVPMILLTGEMSGLHAVATGETDAKTLILGTVVTVCFRSSVSHALLVTPNNADTIACFLQGFFGFLIGIAGLLSVKVTSPVSHMVSSAARGVLQSAVGVLAFHEIITRRRMLSIGVIIAGSCHYVWVKNQEQQAAAVTSKPSSSAAPGADEESQIPLVSTHGGLDPDENEDEDMGRMFKDKG